MTRTLILTLAIELDDLPEAERGELCEAASLEAGELESVADIDPISLGGQIAEVLTDQEAMRDLLWPGSEMFARIVGAKRLAASFDSSARVLALADDEKSLVANAVINGRDAFRLQKDTKAKFPEAFAQGLAIWDRLAAKVLS